MTECIKLSLGRPYQKCGICGVRPKAYTIGINERAINQAREKIAQLAGQNLDLVTFWQASTEALRHAVPTLPVALLVHARSSIAVGDQPLSDRVAAIAARVSRT
jgi:hypothetical protein